MQMEQSFQSATVSKKLSVITLEEEFTVTKKIYSGPGQNWLPQANRAWLAA